MEWAFPEEGHVLALPIQLLHGYLKQYGLLKTREKHRTGLDDLRNFCLREERDWERVDESERGEWLELLFPVTLPKRAHFKGVAMSQAKLQPSLLPIKICSKRTFESGAGARVRPKYASAANGQWTANGWTPTPRKGLINVTKDFGDLEWQHTANSTERKCRPHVGITLVDSVLHRSFATGSF